MSTETQVKKVSIPENTLKALMNCATNTDLCRLVANETSVEFNEQRFSLLFKATPYDSLEATTTFGTNYEVYYNIKGWVAKYNGSSIGDSLPAASADEAKDICNEDYRERLRKINCKLF